MTTPGFLGADVDALTRLRSSLDAAATTLDSLRTATTGRLEDFSRQGRDAQNFRQSRLTRSDPALRRPFAALSTAAAGIGKQRAQQETASGSGRPSFPGASAPATVHPAPSPAEPSPAEPSTGGGPTGTATSVEVPFYSQFAAGHGFTPGNTACFKAATAMAHQAGADVLGPGQRIQVATGEHADGSVTIDSGAAATGRSYIDQQLDSGRPVVVGVSHKKAHYYVDGITDHFVVITGRGTDEAGNPFYTFNDPATRMAEKGADTNPANRFHIDDTGRMWSDGSRASGYVVDRHIEVSMVRRNR